MVATSGIIDPARRGYKYPTKTQIMMRNFGVESLLDYRWQEINQNLIQIQSYEQFQKIPNCVIMDGILNWGRIIVLFEWAVSQARREPEMKNFIIMWLYKWLCTDFACNWITMHGGWKNFMQINYK